jgi:hypothetical protein
MISEYSRIKANIVKTYERDMNALKQNLPVIDVYKKAAKFWKKLTGAEASVYFYDDHCHMSLQMNHIKPNGRFVSRELDLNLLIEFMDEALEPLGFELRAPETDTSSTDFKWARPTNPYTPSTIFAYHGGNCTYKKVGEETVTRGIYEMHCS